MRTESYNNSDLPLRRALLLDDIAAFPAPYGYEMFILGPNGHQPQGSAGYRLALYAEGDGSINATTRIALPQGVINYAVTNILGLLAPHVANVITKTQEIQTLSTLSWKNLYPFAILQYHTDVPNNPRLSLAHLPELTPEAAANYMYTYLLR